MINDARITLYDCLVSINKLDRGADIAVGGHRGGGTSRWGDIARLFGFVVAPGGSE
jgi:hypothetical protein